MRGRSLALSLLLLGGAAAGCGDDGGGDADAQPFVDALVTSLQDDDGPAPTDEQAECIAEAAVDAIGVDTFEEQGVTPEDVAASDGPEDVLDLSEDQAGDIAEAFIDCDFDFATAFAGPDASEELIACVEENLDEDVLVEAFTLQFQGDEEGANAAAEAMLGDVETECAALAGG